MSKALVRLGWVVAVVYAVWGLVVGLWPSHWEEASVTEQVLYVVFMVGGASLVVAGLRYFRNSPWAGAVLISVGGLLGAAPVFWSIAAPLAAIALVVLSIRDARRASAGA
jgi:hypothetical protein